jgi:hypothetical protein
MRFVAQVARVAAVAALMVWVHVAPEYGDWELFGFHLVVADGKAVGLRLTQVGPHHNKEWTISRMSS